MFDYKKCDKCKMFLPRKFLTPAQMTKGNRKKRVWLCSNCKKIIIERQKNEQSKRKR